MVPCLVISGGSDFKEDEFWEKFTCRRMTIFGRFDNVLERGKGAVMDNDETWFDSPKECLMDLDQKLASQKEHINALLFTILLF